MRINYHPKRIQGEKWWALFCHGQMRMMIDRRERKSLKQSSVQFDPAPSIKQYCSGHLQCNQCGGDDFGGANIILSLASQTSAETCPSVLFFFFYQSVSLYSESVVFGPWKSYIFGSKDKEEFMEMGPRGKRGWLFSFIPLLFVLSPPLSIIFCTIRSQAGDTVGELVEIINAGGGNWGAHESRGRRLKLPERGPIQRKPNVKSSFQINTWSDLWAIIISPVEEQQQFKSPSQKRGEQMMGRDGGRLGSTWNAIETPSWGCWVSDIIAVRKGLNAAALGGGWSIRGTWPWRWWKH